MDASTTALSVARHLKARVGWSQLTVVTNGLRIASELAGHPGITVLMLGGRVRWEALSLVGQLGDGLFSRINVQKAFLGAAGFTVESGLSDATDEEAQIKRSMVAAAREVIAIVDHTKWERTAFATFCPTDKIDIVLTDDGGTGRDGQGTRGARRRRPARHRRPGDDAHDRRIRRHEVVPVTEATSVRDAAPRGAARDLQAIRRDAGPRQRLARPPARRGPRSRRRERRRQEHAGQDPGRRPPARQRHDLARRRGDDDPRPSPRASARDRRRPPGAAPLPGPDRRRERVHRPRARGPAGHDRLGRRRAGRPRRCSTSSTCSSTSARPSGASRWPTSSSSRSRSRSRSTPAC